MALLDRLAQAQQIVSGYENREINKQRYETDLGFRQSAEERAMAAENRAAQLFPTEKAIEDFRLASVGLGIRSVMDELAATGEQKAVSNNLESVQRQIIQFQRLVTQNPSAVTAKMFNEVEESTYQLIQKHPSLAASIAPLYTSMVDAANLAIKEGRPTQLTKAGASKAYKREYTTVGREAGKIGSSLYNFPTGPNLRAGLLSSTTAGATVVPSTQFESGMENIREQTGRVEQTMKAFPNFLGLIGSPYTSAFMSTIPNEQ